MMRRYTREYLESRHPTDLMWIGVRDFGLDFTVDDIDDPAAVIDAILKEQATMSDTPPTSPPVEPVVHRGLRLVTGDRPDDRPRCERFGHPIELGLGADPGACFAAGLPVHSPPGMSRACDTCIAHRAPTVSTAPAADDRDRPWGTDPVAATAALRLIAGDGCESATHPRDPSQQADHGTCFRHGKVADARYADDQACPACIAHAGLTGNLADLATRKSD